MEYENLLQDILHGVLSKSYEIEASSLSPEAVEYRGPEEDFFEILDEESQKILMHRDVHFGGSFSIMLEYYEREEAPGIQEDIFIEGIQELDSLERKMKKNIAPYILKGIEAERVAFFRAQYRKFQELYSMAPKNSTESLIASLFLSDGEWEEVLEQVDSSLPQKENLLIEILMNDEFQESLSPSFGTAPQAIVRLLGERKSEKAIPYLFSTIGCGHFDLEEEVICSLQKIGNPAKEFCLKKARSSSEKECERALIALQVFHPDESVRQCALELLEIKKSWPTHLKEYIKSLTQK